MIICIDPASRRVTGQIILEKPDRYNYILGYYPEAFINWHGAIHEMFDHAKPVAKVSEIIADSEKQMIRIVSLVSKHAPETLNKLLDGELSDCAPAFIPDAEFGNNPAYWPKKEYEGKEYPYLPKYAITGISYVDKSPLMPSVYVEQDA